MKLWCCSKKKWPFNRWGDLSEFSFTEKCPFKVINVEGSRSLNRDFTVLHLSAEHVSIFALLPSALQKWNSYFSLHRTTTTTTAKCGQNWPKIFHAAFGLVLIWRQTLTLTDKQIKTFILCSMYFLQFYGRLLLQQHFQQNCWTILHRTQERTSLC